MIRVDPVQRAITDLAAGRPVVVLDSVDRENEGDLIMAADAATPEWMSLFVRYGSGFICVPLTGERAETLALPLMVARGEESLGTAFTVSVDARRGIGTGISAADRSHTVRLLADPLTVAADLVRPGHVLPLRAHPGGVRARQGHTEAAVDLVRLAGRGEVGVIVELVEDDGSMRRGPSCRQFADEHGLALITIADLVAHLGGPLPEPLAPTAAGLSRVASTRLPIAEGMFTAYGYRDAAGLEHVALTVGDVSAAGGTDPVSVRVHSECLTGDVLGSLRCDCGPQLHATLARIQAEARGVVVYVCGHEGRGIGLAAKLAAYRLQETGRDTVQANEDLGLPVDSRDYSVAARILNDLEVGPVRLLTNNPDKVTGLRRYGVDVVARDGVVIPPTLENFGYLDTKRRRLGHDLPVTMVDGVAGR